VPVQVPPATHVDELLVVSVRVAFVGKAGVDDVLSAAIAVVLLLPLEAEVRVALAVVLTGVSQMAVVVEAAIVLFWFKPIPADSVVEPVVVAAMVPLVVGAQCDKLLVVKVAKVLIE